MKFTWIALPGVLLLSACSSSQPNALRPPRIGMPNPAAVYCEQQWRVRYFHTFCQRFSGCLSRVKSVIATPCHKATDLLSLRKPCYSGAP